MQLSKTNLLMLLCDAYTYHMEMGMKRQQKRYKNKKLKNKNDELIEYHSYKLYEIDRIITELKENDKIKIKNDYN